jgi:cytochrome P450
MKPMFRFDPYSPAVDSDPFPLYRILRDEHPCFWSEDAGMWVLSRHADISAALANWRTFSSAHGNLMDELPNRAGATLGTTDPPRHDRMRALIQHAFMQRNLETLSEPIRRMAIEAADGLAGRDEFDFIADLSSQVTPRILFLMLGLPPGNDRE